MTAKEPPADFNPQTQGAFTVKTADGAARVIAYEKRDMFIAQAQHVVECFSQGRQPLVTAKDGIESLRVAAAILKAGVARRAIKL
jgi:predicted dehydrogenase